LRVESWNNELVVRQSPTNNDVSEETEDVCGVRHQATTGADIAN
jgi:hypothetical protein